MKSKKIATRATVLAGGMSALLMAFVVTASPASADPTPPLPPAPAPPTPAPAPVPGAPQPVDLQAAGPDAVTPPPNGIPHLASPDALPPGTTMDPNAASGDSPDVSYLKNLWDAVQNHEISGKEALIMGLAQRGMSTPMPDQAPGPNVPISPGNGPAPAPIGPPPPPAPPAP